MIKEHRKRFDRGNIMNPGKVTQRTLVSRLVDVAALIEPFALPLGNMSSTRIGERPSGPVRGIPADVA